MKQFSDCAGKCCDCITHYIGGCLAGHGDDEFRQITIEDAKQIIKRKGMDEYRISSLIKKFPEISQRIKIIWQEHE